MEKGAYGAVRQHSQRRFPAKNEHAPRMIASFAQCPRAWTSRRRLAAPTRRTRHQHSPKPQTLNCLLQTLDPLKRRLAAPYAWRASLTP
eukprot:1624034-Rhodomonas_salina.2